MKTRGFLKLAYELGYKCAQDAQLYFNEDGSPGYGYDQVLNGENRSKFALGSGLAGLSAFNLRRIGKKTGTGFWKTLGRAKALPWWATMAMSVPMIATGLYSMFPRRDNGRYSPVSGHYGAMDNPGWRIPR